MTTSWWATDVRDLIADGLGGRSYGRTGSNRKAASAGAMLPVLHLAGDVVLGRAVAGMALSKAPLALAAAALPALLLGGAAVAAAAYLSSRSG